MTSKLFLLCAGLMTLIAIACGGDDENGGGDATPPGETPAVTPLPDVTPTPGPDGSEPPIIEEIIDAVESGDPATLEALFVFQQIPCIVEGVGAGGPPLCRGEPDGTPVRVAPMGTCEGFYAREGELRLEEAVTGDATFDAAYRFDGVPFWAGATYGVVFALPEDMSGPQGYAVLATDDGVVGVQYGCGWTAAEFADIPGFDEVIREAT